LEESVSEMETSSPLCSARDSREVIDRDVCWTQVEKEEEGEEEGGITADAIRSVLQVRAESGDPGEVSGCRTRFDRVQ
jgi:hypothetical protein